MNFAERLKTLIEKSDMNQKQLSEVSGITEAAISRYLHGTRMPNMVALCKMKNALGCDWDELIGE